MPLVLHRLRTGMIYSQAFADYLAAKHGREQADHMGEVLHLDYVRCSQGNLAGQSWWQLSWMNGWQAPAEHRHTIGEVEVCILHQALRGLKDRLLHFDGQRVMIKK